MSSPAVHVDANAGYWMRRDAPSTPSSRYPEGFTIRVTEARAMRDPKNHKKSIGVYEVCTFTKSCSTFDAYHANNKRWKRFSEFEQLNKLMSDHLDGASSPSLPSKHSMRGSRSKVLLEDRRKGLEKYMGDIIKLFYSTKNFMLKRVIVRWMNLHMGDSYVVHVNLVQGVDKDTSEYIDPSDAEGDKNDSLFGGMPKIKAPKLGMPSMPKLGMPSMSMPKLGMPSMPSMPGMPGLPGLPSLGDSPADIEARARAAAAALAERQENALAYLDALPDKERDHHIIARQCAYIQQNGNGWTYLDEEKNGDHWMFDRELQTAVRTISSQGVLSNSEDKTTYYWDEPIFVSGDIFELPLTKKQSKPGILNWAMPDEDDVHTVRITLGTSQRRIIKMEFMGKGGADFCKGKEKTDTRKIYYDTVPPTPQHEHPLVFFASRYGGNYQCNICSGSGTGEAYSCDACKFDCHPHCKE